MNYSIYAESTPNPEVMKFVANRMLADKSLEILNSTDAKNIPLANELFKLPFIKSVFISTNFVSVTKIEKVEWENIAMQLRIYISDFLNSIDVMNHTENISANIEVDEKKVINDQREFIGDEREIAEILDEYIRPAVASDGGNIAFKSYDEESKVVSVILQGACSGCPSSTITLKNGIETMLQEMLPNEISQVVAING